jgi:regulator of replication initiation timing
MTESSSETIQIINKIDSSSRELRKQIGKTNESMVKVFDRLGNLEATVDGVKTEVGDLKSNASHVDDDITSQIEVHEKIYHKKDSGQDKSKKISFDIPKWAARVAVFLGISIVAGMGLVVKSCNPEIAQKAYNSVDKSNASNP